jgi:hypothetical protein
MEKQKYTQCQSCGMPLKKDIQGGGTEKDGSISQMYCSSCYKDGHFITEAKTAQEMQVFVDRILSEEMGANRIFRWLATWQIPRLKRWKSK